MDKMNLHGLPRTGLNGGLLKLTLLQEKLTGMSIMWADPYRVVTSMRFASVKIILVDYL